ncbi:hypothetical protein CFC21_112184 [Triticum aestivum]|uniref:Uncharacterized protein n=2 Tax=Triticum aestivum TaxID=4565 RepID=A0A3B6PHP9_WHEAT|nr:hypothetical protein [Triticum aestivum]
MAADPTAPVSGDHDERPSGQCKGALSHQANKSTDGKGKEVANAQDHGSDGANQRRRRRHLIVDTNKVPHDDDGDGDFDSPLPATAGGVSCWPPQQHPHRALEIEIGVRMLELERQRVKWAAANLREEMELKNMRLEDSR